MKEIIKRPMAWLLLVFIFVLIGLITINRTEVVAVEETQTIATPTRIAAPTRNQERQTQQRSKGVEVHKIEDVLVTHYDCCYICCGKEDGITASGRLAVPYKTIAVPEEIPLGAVVFVRYPDGSIIEYSADDRGGAIEGAHIDVCVKTHDEALELGIVKGCTLYWYLLEEK